MSIADKLNIIAENQQKVYEAGRQSAQGNPSIDPDKIITATATGTGSVALDDVSEIPHNITIELSKTMYGKNLSPIGTIQFTQVAQKLPVCGWSETIPAGTYTFSAVITTTETADNTRCAVGFYDEAEQQISAIWILANVNRRTYSAITLDKPARYLYLYADSSWSAAAGDTATFEDIQLELGSVATEYEQYREPYPITDGLEVVVHGKNIFPLEALDEDNWYQPSGDTSKYFNFTLPIGIYTISAKNNVTDGYYGYFGVQVSNNNFVTNNFNDLLGNGATLKNERLTFNVNDGDSVRFKWYGKNFKTPWCYYYDAQIEIGTVATEYIPVNKTICSSGNVRSISPNMSFTADSEVDIKVSYRKSWGMYEEWSRFWDSYQDYGKRTSYPQAFTNTGWNSTTFKPKYDLIVTGNAYYMFGYSHITEIPFIDLTGTTSLSQIFYYCSKLKTIKLIKVSKNNLFVANVFYNCSALEDIEFEGEIAGDLDFHYSSNLTKESMLNILNCLYDYSTTEETHNLYFGQGLMESLTEAEKAIATQKGWTIF